MNIDFATRAYDHGFKFDPIVRSLLDLDFYKLLMQQFIWERYPNEVVRFSVKNRTKSIRLAEIIDINELRQQLDHARTLRFRPSELVWLRGQTFYGQEGIFSKGYIDTLRTFQLPEYRLTVEKASIYEDNIQGYNSKYATGQYSLTFEGPWWQVTMWEIFALTIINELRFRTLMRGMSKGKLDIMFAQAKVKVYRKLKKLAKLEKLAFSDFGTRRRFGFLWQEYCVLLAKEMLGDRMKGTSNVYLAFKHDLEPIGTNAHELPMVFAALARHKNPDDREALVKSQYEVLHQWSNAYHGNLLVGLPDTFGTTQFLNNAPWEISLWKGFRPDSKEPIEGINELIRYWKRCGDSDEKIATQRLAVAADGLDVEIDGYKVNGSDITAIYDYFVGKVPVSFGMGTNLTCDFIGCHPDGDDIMRSLSVVAKVDRVNYKYPAVKLSDNYQKRSGDPAEVEYYTEVFGTEGMENVPVLV